MDDESLLTMDDESRTGLDPQGIHPHRRRHIPIHKGPAAATHPSIKGAALRAASTKGGGRPPLWIPLWMGVWRRRVLCGWVCGASCVDGSLGDHCRRHVVLPPAVFCFQKTTF